MHREKPKKDGFDLIQVQKSKIKKVTNMLS